MHRSPAAGCQLPGAQAHVGSPVSTRPTAVVAHGVQAQWGSVAATLRAARRAPESTRWRQPAKWPVAALRTARGASITDGDPNGPATSHVSTARPSSLRTLTPREVTVIQATTLYYALDLGRQRCPANLAMPVRRLADHAFARNDPPAAIPTLAPSKNAIAAASRPQDE